MTTCRSSVDHDVGVGAEAGAVAILLNARYLPGLGGLRGAAGLVEDAEDEHPTTSKDLSTTGRQKGPQLPRSPWPWRS